MSIVDIDVDKGGQYLLRFKYDPNILEAIKTIPSRKWDGTVKAHYISKYDVEPTIIALRAGGYSYNFTEAAEQGIAGFIQAKKKLLILKNLSSESVSLKVTLKLPLRPFQVVGHNYLTEVRSCILADEMGVGKTVQTIATYKTFKEQGKVNKMMVICPSSVKSTGWEKDIKKFTDLEYVVIEGTPAERKRLYEKSYDIIILGYETFLNDFGIAKKANKFPLPQIEMLVCDECQRLVRSKNKITQSLLIFKEKLNLQYVYLVTGTPLMNKIEDLWSLLYAINPELAGEFWSFRQRYCVIEYKEITMLDKKLLKKGIYKKVTRNIPKVIGYKNLHELRDKMAPYYIRREKKEVLPELPDKIFETYFIDLTPKQRVLYEIVKSNYQMALKASGGLSACALVWIVRAKQICDSPEIYIDENGEPSKLKESAKFKELKNLIEDFIPVDEDGYPLPGGRKVVLFSQYKEMTDIFVREFENYKPLYLHGQVESKNRPLLIDAFQEDPEYKLFVSTLRAGGVGITLTASDIVILYDKWFSPAANNQAMDRVHRIGQKNAVTVIDFKCKDTIEERIEKIIERKVIMFQGMFGEDETVIAKLTPEELSGLL